MMRRWVTAALVAVLSISLAIPFWVHLSAARHLRSFAQPTPFTHVIPADAMSIARGQHLVQTRGCAGCHGEQLQGELMWGHAVAPNLAAYAREETPATFEAAVRHAIGRDGRALYSMPSYNFVHLRDADLADIVAYLRSVPVVQAKLPRASLPWKIKLDIALGRDATIPAYLDRVPPLQRADDPDPRIARGEYIAMTTCNECHGFSLRGDTPWEDHAPDLLIVMAYDEAAFTKLMRTGLALGDRELPMMSPVARGRFVHFTDEEVADLYAFLRDMGARASAQ